MMLRSKAQKKEIAEKENITRKRVRFQLPEATPAIESDVAPMKEGIEKKPTTSKANKDVKDSSNKLNGDVIESPKPKKTRAVKAKAKKPAKDKKPKKALSKVNEVAADVPKATNDPEKPAEKKETKKKAVKGKKREGPVNNADKEPTRGVGVSGRTRAAAANAANKVEEPQTSSKALLNATHTDYKKSDFELLAQVSQGLRRLTISGNKEQGFLKISSWNIVGSFPSWLKKDRLKYLDYEKPDIFCIQADKVSEEAEMVQGYHRYKACTPRGLTGVAIYSKIVPIYIDYGTGADGVHGRIMSAEYEKFYLVNVYVPSSGRKLVNKSQRMRWEGIFKENIKIFDSQKPVIISGNMNCAHKEIDLANPQTSTQSAGFTQEERDKLSELLSLGFVDTFRHLYPDQKEAYTYSTCMDDSHVRNVGWRLDYFLVSERIAHRVIDSCIRSQCKGSDHCPITLFIDL